MPLDCTASFRLVLSLAAHLVKTFSPSFQEVGETSWNDKETRLIKYQRTNETIKKGGKMRKDDYLILLSDTSQKNTKKIPGNIFTFIDDKGHNCLHGRKYKMWMVGP